MLVKFELGNQKSESFRGRMATPQKRGHSCATGRMAAFECEQEWSRSIGNPARPEVLPGAFQALYVLEDLDDLERVETGWNGLERFIFHEGFRFRFAMTPIPSRIAPVAASTPLLHHSKSPFLTPNAFDLINQTTISQTSAL